MENKIINLPETELQNDSIIRFEVGDNQLTIKIDGDMLLVQKINFKTGDDTILITPAASNRIYIK